MARIKGSLLNASGAQDQGGLEFYTRPVSSGSATLTQRMLIDPNGNVAINTTDAKGYKLAVNGTDIATSMTVKLYANWPDFIFKPAYGLPSLADVKTYIDQNHHLRDVPTATDVEKNGLNLGEMNKVLLQKVEELTLYLIEKDKQLKEYNKRLTEQEILNRSLRRQINKLAKQNQVASKK